MFQRFHEKRKNDEGFTLIELLVVILIIAILAAIAIPVFLRQREKGWIGQAESALKNAATAEESFATSNNGSYTASKADLITEGYRDTAAVALTATLVGSSGYCLQANHDQLSVNYKLESTVGRPVTGSC